MCADSKLLWDVAHAWPYSREQTVVRARYCVGGLFLLLAVMVLLVPPAHTSCNSPPHGFYSWSEVRVHTSCNGFYSWSEVSVHTTCNGFLLSVPRIDLGRQNPYQQGVVNQIPCSVRLKESAFRIMSTIK